MVIFHNITGFTVFWSITCSLGGNKRLVDGLSDSTVQFCNQLYLRVSYSAGKQEPHTSGDPQQRGRESNW